MSLEDYPASTVNQLWTWLRRAEEDAKVYVTLDGKTYGLDAGSVIEHLIEAVDDGGEERVVVDGVFFSLHPVPIPEGEFDPPSESTETADK